MEVRIRYCTVCWGYRNRALELAEALRKKFDARAEVTGGKPGQFDVYVDDREVVSRSQGAILRMKPGGLPEIAEVIAVIENGFAPFEPEPNARLFAPENAKRFYDRFGAMQDIQVYEHGPLNHLISHADFEHAFSVFELGCGTGRLAARLFAERLSAQARYQGIDISTTMVEIASRRLARWSGRANVEQADGTKGLSFAAHQFDRFVATYVFDLLSLSSIGSLVEDAHRLLTRDGKLCVVTSTEGIGPISRLVSRLWRAIYERRPGILGGCRPLSVSKLLDATKWRIEYSENLSSWGISSEIVVASPAI